MYVQHGHGSVIIHTPPFTEQWLSKLGKRKVLFYENGKYHNTIYLIFASPRSCGVSMCDIKIVDAAGNTESTCEYCQNFFKCKLVEDNERHFNSWFFIPENEELDFVRTRGVFGTRIPVELLFPGFEPYMLVPGHENANVHYHKFDRSVILKNTQALIRESNLRQIVENKYRISFKNMMHRLRLRMPLIDI